MEAFYNLKISVINRDKTLFVEVTETVGEYILIEEVLIYLDTISGVNLQQKAVTHKYKYRQKHNISIFCIERILIQEDEKKKIIEDQRLVTRFE